MKRKELIVLTKSKKLAVLTYELTKRLPKTELYAITNQINRASVSVPSNIAEGQQRTNKEFINFLRIARGSLAELEVQLEIIKEVYNLENPEIFNLINEIGKMIYVLTQRLNA